MNELISYAKKFIGTPYIWGGSHPAKGFDCSGLIQHILASVGMDPAGDQTAQALYDHFIKNGDEVWGFKTGALVFYGHDIQSITHISMCVNSFQVIEAGGGGSKTIDTQSAVAAEAYVRIRPVDHRKDVIAVIFPRYPDWIRQTEMPLG